MSAGEIMFGNPLCEKCMGRHPSGYDCQAALERMAERMANMPIVKGVARPLLTVWKPPGERWVTQDKFYDAATGAKGNCLQAAVASLLGLPLEDVPHFIVEHESASDIWDAVDAFFEARGFVLWQFYRNTEYNSIATPDVYYLASGPSPRGVSHAVIMRGGKLVHDPHPSRAGIDPVEVIHVPMAIDAASFAPYPLKMGG